MTEYRKEKGKCLPIKIDKAIREKIEIFKQRLLQMASQPDETSEFDAETINIICYALDDYDRNILLAYYSVAECSPTRLGNMLGIRGSVAASRVKSIIKKIKNMNNVTKTIDNHTRVHYDPDEWFYNRC